jgi:tRNA(Ile2) C34 agmatinyltransferase TiaS
MATGEPCSYCSGLTSTHQPWCPERGPKTWGKDEFSCPSCAALRAEVKRLEEAVEWAMENGNYNPSVQMPGYLKPMECKRWKDELRRKAGRE